MAVYIINLMLSIPWYKTSASLCLASTHPSIDLCLCHYWYFKWAVLLIYCDLGQQERTSSGKFFGSSSWFFSDKRSHCSHIRCKTVSLSYQKAFDIQWERKRVNEEALHVGEALAWAENGIICGCCLQRDGSDAQILISPFSVSNKQNRQIQQSGSWDQSHVDCTLIVQLNPVNYTDDFLFRNEN